MQILIIKDEKITKETKALANAKGFSSFSDFFTDNVEWIDINNGLDETRFNGLTQSLLARWLREVHHKLVVAVPAGVDGYRFFLFRLDDPVRNEFGFNYITPNPRYGPTSWDTYELALEAGLQEALKLLPDVNT